jgi:hypothetical protein
MPVVLELPSQEELEHMDARERAVLLHRYIEAERALFVGFADLFDVAERAGDHVTDGHRSIKHWYRAHADTTSDDAFAKVKAMRTMRTLPGIRDGLIDGHVTLAQLRSVVWAHGNPRVREHLPLVEDQILEYAKVMDLAEFDRTIREYTDLADADGAEQRAEATHDRRSAHHSKVGGGFAGNYNCGAAQGVIIDKVVRLFAQREFDADWTEAKARVGEKVTTADLARTVGQRRMDAMVAICLAAASTAPGANLPEPLVNLVMDVRTFEETAEWVATGAHPPTDFTDLASRRCETSDGVRIPRADALAAALIGQVRRVIVDAKGVTIDLGRKRRLFTGNARDAVMLRNTTCVWAGCDAPASQCQADHINGWGKGAGTNHDEGAPCCGKHNRWKNRGYTTHQDDDGRWQTLRPDGTNINSPPAA